MPVAETERLPDGTYLNADHAYRDLVRQVIENGVRKENRTGTDAVSCFAAFYMVNLQAGFPLLTTKKIFFDSMLRELIWYLAGEDHIRELRKHTRIWDAWADEEGNLQTAYGRYWRRFPIPAPSARLGAEVFATPDDPRLSSHVRQEADGSFSFDQIDFVAAELKRNPRSRRLVVSAWHPANAAASLLPPCHFAFVFSAEPDPAGGPDRLNCHLTQRSADLALGVPFNLACYALLTHILAHEVGMVPGRFAHTLIDAHVYVNHIDGLKEQMTREPLSPPILFLAPGATLDGLQIDDVALEGYEHHPAIRFPVAV
ncbi:thymidylate synthase [soil metagenome]